MVMIVEKIHRILSKISSQNDHLHSNFKDIPYSLRIANEFRL